MWLVVAHRISAIRDRAVEPFRLMEGLLPAPKRSFQLVLAPLCGVLLVIAASCRQFRTFRVFW